MLAAYFDETGLNPSSPVVGICGFVGRTIEWARLDLAWAKCIARCEAPSVFHAAECQDGDGEFFGLSRGIREALLTGLSDLIVERDLCIINGMVAKDDWDQFASMAQKARFKTPYHFCFEFVLQKLSSWSIEYAAGEPVAVVLANHQQYRERASEIHQAYRASDQYPHIGSLSFEKPQEVIPLQAADLLSYESYHYMKRRIATRTDGRLEDCSPVLAKLIGHLLLDPKHAGYFDRENIPHLKPDNEL